MTDVLFITPTVTDNAFEESHGTLILSTILRDRGIQADILPFYRIGRAEDFPAFLTSAIEKICEASPKIISFYTRCDCYHIMLRIAEQIKSRLDCYVVFAGPQADITAMETLEEIPYVDFICCGEGETTVFPFFSSLLNGTPDLSVRGLVYRNTDRICANPKPELIKDLDNSVFIDYSTFAPNARFDTTTSMPLDVGRGCPFGCTYCSTNTFWGRKYRLKSPARIVEELKYYHDRFGVSYFAFEHDMFTMHKKSVIETCQLMRELDFQVTWRCSARLDCIDKELIDIMTESGLKRLYVGIETGSPRMQKLINKNLDLDRVLPMLSYISTKNIEIVTSFIFGFPDETEEDISQTLRLIIEIAKMPKVTIQTHLCTFLPGTALSEKYKSNLTPTTHISDITGNVGLSDCKDLIEAHPKLFWHFSEYKTELRERLKHFPLFVRLLRLIPHVYRYFAESYDNTHLIQLYFDFAQDNADILNDSGKTDEEKLRELVKNDRYAKRFADTPYADIIADIYRLETARQAVWHDEIKTVTELCCFSPFELNT